MLPKDVRGETFVSRGWLVAKAALRGCCCDTPGGVTAWLVAMAALRGCCCDTPGAGSNRRAHGRAYETGHGLTVGRTPLSVFQEPKRGLQFTLPTLTRAPRGRGGVGLHVRGPGPGASCASKLRQQAAPASCASGWGYAAGGRRRRGRVSRVRRRMSRRGGRARHVAVDADQRTGTLRSAARRAGARATAGGTPDGTGGAGFGRRPAAASGSLPLPLWRRVVGSGRQCGHDRAGAAERLAGRALDPVDLPPGRHRPCSARPE